MEPMPIGATSEVSGVDILFVVVVRIPPSGEIVLIERLFTVGLGLARLCIQPGRPLKPTRLAHFVASFAQHPNFCSSLKETAPPMQAKSIRRKTTPPPTP